MRKVLLFLYQESNFFKSIVDFILPNNKKLVKIRLQESFLGQCINSFYDRSSLENKAFYNIGAGNQRSKYDFWSYVDLKDSKYCKDNIDVYFDLESLKTLPIEENSAEVIFSSFVIEHISIEATKNLCKEAYRVLKEGGVFHSKVHCYDYAHRLLRNNLISPMVPFLGRETLLLVDSLLKRSNGKVVSYFNKDKEYVLQNKKDKDDMVVFSAENSFLYHNATASIANIENPKEFINKIKSKDNFEFYNELKTHVDTEKKKPHQHNADYFSKEEMLQYIKELGFKDVYFTQPYQSVSPALWEEELNPVHKGFLFSIEAVK